MHEADKLFNMFGWNDRLVSDWITRNALAWESELHECKISHGVFLKRISELNATHAAYLGKKRIAEKK